MAIVKYYGMLKEATGTGQEQLEGNTLKELLAVIKARHGKKAYQTAKSGLITANGVNATLTQGFATKLSPEDVICFMPACGGG